MGAGTLTHIIAFIMIAVVFSDVVSTIVVPRQISRRYRLMALLITCLFWPLARAVIRRITDIDLREQVRGFFGPFCFLAGLTVWVVVLLLSFGLLFLPHGIGSIGNWPDLVNALYMSGSSILTLGVSDSSGLKAEEKILVVLGAMLGITLIGLCVSYLFLLHNALSERERVVNTFEVFRDEASDGVGLLCTFADLGMKNQLSEFYHRWMEWTAGIYETHRAFPLLLFFSSSSKNSTWLSSLTIMLDASNLLQTVISDASSGRSIALFRLGNSLLMDLSGLLHLKAISDDSMMVSEEEYQSWVERLEKAGFTIRKHAACRHNFNLHRRAYWGFVRAMAEFFADDKVRC